MPMPKRGETLQCAVCQTPFYAQLSRLKKGTVRFCSKHCAGLVNGSGNAKPKATLSERLWSRIERRGPDDCWPWLGRLNDGGYGALKDGGQRLVASRIVCTEAHGEPPEGMLALHSCDNPPCCNPAHLRWGTQADNLADMDKRGRRRPFMHGGERNHAARLTREDVAAIRARYGAGETIRSLASPFGVHESTIGAVVNRKTWTCVP